MASRSLIARELAASLLAGAWTRTRLIARAQHYLGKGAPKALARLIDHVLASVETSYPPAPHDLARALMASKAFDAAARGLLRAEQPPPIVMRSPAFAPSAAFAGLPVPPIGDARRSRSLA